MIDNNFKKITLGIFLITIIVFFSRSVNAIEANSEDNVSQLIKDHNSKYLTIQSGMTRGYNKSKKVDEYVDITHFLNKAKREMVFPLEKNKYIITSDFGVRRHPFLGTQASKEIYSLPFHSGLDISYSNIKGDEVYSVLDGRVKLISRNINSYGNLVVIDHDGMQTYYAHLDTIDENLKLGGLVKAGEKLGTVGSTGRSTGAHLHIEFNIGDISINPRIFLEGNYEMSDKPVKIENKEKVSKEKVDLEVKDFKLDLLEIDNSLVLDEELNQIDVNSILDTENSFIELKSKDAKTDKWEDMKFEIIPLAKSEESNLSDFNYENKNIKVDNTDNKGKNKTKVSWSLLGHNDFQMLRLDKNN